MYTRRQTGVNFTFDRVKARKIDAAQVDSYCMNTLSFGLALLEIHRSFARFASIGTNLINNLYGFRGSESKTHMNHAS